MTNEKSRRSDITELSEVHLFARVANLANHIIAASDLPKTTLDRTLSSIQDDLTLAGERILGMCSNCGENPLGETPQHLVDALATATATIQEGHGRSKQHEKHDVNIYQIQQILNWIGSALCSIREFVHKHGDLERIRKFCKSVCDFFVTHPVAA